MGPLRGTALVLAAVATAALAVATAACGKSGGTSAAKVQAGATLFAQNCAVCHGQGGRGGTAPVLDAKEMLSVASDQQLTNIIRVGIPGTQMRSWSQELGGPFDDKSVGELVAYLRSLEPNAPSVPNWRQGAAATTSTTSAPPTTAGPSPTTSSSTP